MKILITGATGSIGQELTKALAVKEHSLALLVRDATKAVLAFAAIPDQQLTLIIHRAPDWISQVAKFSPEVVIHLAALLTSRDDLEVIPGLIASNIAFGTELLQALKGTSVRRFVNTGTFAEYFYGDGQLSPAYLYSATKTAFHSILKYYQQLLDFKVVNIIPYTVYGQADTQPKIIDHIYNSFFADQPANMSGGEQTLDFIHIHDVVTFYCVVVEQERGTSKLWEDYHLGTGRGTTLRGLAQLLSARLDLPENINWGALPYRDRDTMHSIAPLAKAINHFGWQPAIDIASGIDKYLADK